MSVKKVKRGWYTGYGYHLVSTERLGKDSAIDWVAVKTEEEAERIYHGHTPSTYVHIHSTLRDLKRHIEQEEANSL